MEINIIQTSDPSKKTKLTLDQSIFGITPHKQAMRDTIIAQRSSLRQGTHKVKDRSEVSGGGRKP